MFLVFRLLWELWGPCLTPRGAPRGTKSEKAQTRRRPRGLNLSGFLFLL